MPQGAAPRRSSLPADLTEVIRAPLTAALAAALLAGCGYKAPLYLPASKPEGSTTPAIVLPEPAPDRPVPSEAAPPPK